MASYMSSRWKASLSTCLVTGALVLTSCSSGETSDTNGTSPSAAATPQSMVLAESAEAQQIVDQLRVRFRVQPRPLRTHRDSHRHLLASALRPVIPRPVAESFRSDGDTLRPSFPKQAWRGVIHPADVQLPMRASDAFQLSDRDSGMTIRAALAGAAGEAKAEAAEGYVVYRHALGDAGHVLHRASTRGTEDYLVFEAPPPASEVAYTVHLGPKVAGLRLVANVLEFVDEGGAPRLRMASPYLVDGSGQRQDATISLPDCGYDDDPRGPWGRDVVPAGQPSCQVSVSWKGTDLAYPVLLDPMWSTTGSMAAARGGHTASVLASGKVLVAGGWGQAILDSAELYDPATGTWSMVGSMGEGRMAHTASALAGGEVLVAGGMLGGEPSSTSGAELYDTASGTWSATGSLHEGRQEHTASVLLDGRVLLVGGLGGAQGMQDLLSAELYDPASGTWTLTGDTPQPHHAHTASVIADGKVLAAGGMGSGAAGLYDPTSGTWTTTGSMNSDRTRHSASVLASGAVLVAGGEFGGSSAELYIPASGTWTATGPMAEAREDLTASLLAGGEVLVTGGGHEALYHGSAELYVPDMGVWVTAGSMAEGRAVHTASRLPDGKVLIAGGVATGGALSTAELLELTPGTGQPGAPCSFEVECASWLCVDGVCCDTVCDGFCEACSTDLKGSGDDGVCEPISAGLDPDDECLPEAACQDDPSCDGAGQCGCSSGGGAVCQPDGYTIEGPGGTQDCTPYRCTDAGNCLSNCTTAFDCVQGYRCSAEGACVPPDAAAPADEGCACSTVGAGGSSWGLGALGVLVIGAAGGRRRRRRPHRVRA